MYATLQVDDKTITVELASKALNTRKYERLFHSRIIAGQADGTLIYIDPAGKIRVVHGPGPKAAVKQALAQINQAATKLANIAISLK